MKEFKGKALYQPKGKAGEYSHWACNFFVGCSNGCEYCFLKKGIGKATLGGDKPTLKKCFKNERDAISIFEKEMKENLAELQEHGLFLSFTTDPLLSECSDLTWEAVMIAMENDVPIKLLTKMAGKWVNQVAEHMHESWKKYIAFGFTLTGHDELEPNASTNQERIEAMRKLHDAGFKTWASIEPIVDFYESERMISKTIGFCDLYKVGLMSGKKYDKTECYNFVARNTMFSSINRGMFYFKDSLLKQACINRSELPSNCVRRDYNMFTTKK